MLIEEGEDYKNPFLKMPAGFIPMLDGSPYHRFHTTISQKQLNDRKHDIAQGKILGGGSSINGMVYMRGRPSDYNAWENEVGDKYWNWDNLLNSYVALEGNQRFNNKYHGIDGPLKVSDPKYVVKGTDLYIKTMQGLGLPFNSDFNDGNQYGVGLMQLTTNYGKRCSAVDAFINPIRDNKKLKIKSWKRRDVLKDYRFYIVSLNMLAMPWIATGVFVYQSFISDSKTWEVYTIPKAFMVYSITSIATLFVSGFLVDKFTGRKLIMFMNIPLLFAMITLFYFNHEIFAYVFLGLIGVSNGLANILGSSTWAEIYGVKYIGSIKALTTAFMVFSTAFGTAVFGLLIDKGFTIENIAFSGAAYVVISLALLILIRKTNEPVRLSN